MNKEQTIDEVYGNYRKSKECQWTSTHYPTPFTKEEFINKIKTDDEFAKKWGLKIEERELSLEERNYSLGPGKAYRGIFGMNDDLEYKELFDKENRPTRAITITYNNETIESYE